MTKKAGFSLVEMLVAVLLITMLIAVAVFAFKYQLMAIHKTQKVGINKAIIYKQIRSSLQSIKYYIVDEYDNLGYPMKQLHPFFHATKTELNFITESPLFSEDIAIAKLKCEDDKLIYIEEALYGRIDFLRPELLSDSKKTIFYSNLDTCKFTYIFDKKEQVFLKNKIPSSIIIDLSTKKIKTEIFVNVKSDYNRSIGLLNDAIYPIE